MKKFSFKFYKINFDLKEHCNRDSMRNASRFIYSLMKIVMS